MEVETQAHRDHRATKVLLVTRVLLAQKEEVQLDLKEAKAPVVSQVCQDK